LAAFLCVQLLDVDDESGHGAHHLSGEHAAHPIEPPSATLAALQILAMAQAMAVVWPCRPRACGSAHRSPGENRPQDGSRPGSPLPARPMPARSGAPNCRIWDHSTILEMNVESYRRRSAQAAQPASRRGRGNDHKTPAEQR
jgi:hypothetical protein